MNSFLVHQTLLGHFAKRRGHTIQTNCRIRGWGWGSFQTNEVPEDTRDPTRSFLLYRLWTSQRRDRRISFRSSSTHVFPIPESTNLRFFLQNFFAFLQGKIFLLNQKWLLIITKKVTLQHSNAFSFDKSHNVLCWSKFFVPAQKLDCI